jgi:hypothetical protein
VLTTRREDRRSSPILCPLGGDCYNPDCSQSECQQQLFEAEHKSQIEDWEGLGFSHDSAVDIVRKAIRRRSRRRR